MEANKPRFNERRLRAHLTLTNLQWCACQGETINYETLAVMLGAPSKGNALAQAISPILYDVFNFCKEAGLPNLTVLVVRKSGKDKNLPGPGFWKVYAPDKELSFNERVTITEQETSKCFELFSKLGS